MADNLMPPASDWMVVNDGVMGGVSRSRLETGSNGTTRFEGDLSLENNGGFASVRSLLQLEPPTATAKMALSVRGDGNTYQLRFRTDRGFDGLAYASRFETTPGEITTATFSVEDFTPTWRGRRLVNVPSLTWTDVAQIGLMISDKQAGPFALEVIGLEWVPDA